jgi:DNA-binding transcriptional LysR family regulator
MPYTLRQLEYFIAAGETGSITLASERIHISQPSISTAISHLEKELGVQLFIRHHAQGLSLTPAGRDLLREAKVLIAQAEGLYTLASETSGKVRGPLSLGCMVTLAPMLVPELAQSFQTAFPATQVRHIEGNQEQLLEGLRRAEVDVAIAYDLHIPDDIVFKPLVSLPPHVVVSEAHPFAGQTAVSLRELVSEPMILLDLPLSREYFLSLFYDAGLQPLVVARSAHQEVVRTMVANGYGYSIFNVRPRSNHALDGRKLVRVRLAGTHRPMTIGTATLKQLRQSRLVEAFETHCRSFISESYIPGMVAPALERTVRIRDKTTTAL